VAGRRREALAPGLGWASTDGKHTLFVQDMRSGGRPSAAAGSPLGPGMTSNYQEQRERTGSRGEELAGIPSTQRVAPKQPSACAPRRRYRHLPLAHHQLWGCGDRPPSPLASHPSRLAGRPLLREQGCLVVHWPGAGQARKEQRRNARVSHRRHHDRGHAPRLRWGQPHFTRPL